MTKTHQSDAWIGDLVGVFTDPIIVTPGGWGETLPETLKAAVTLERLLENMRSSKEGNPTATDAEAACYLYTASLEAPLGHDWTEIYLYVAGKALNRNRGTTLPEDIRVETISEQQERELADLKRWIYETRMKHRKAHRAVDNHASKEAKPELMARQVPFDLG